MDLSGEFSVKMLCEVLSVNRSGFYKWKKRLEHPSPRLRNLVTNIMLFREYHEKYPSHGYRWLNAKIRLDTGLVVSDQHAHKCCKIAGIVSQSKHYRYKGFFLLFYRSYKAIACPIGKACFYSNCPIIHIQK